MRGKPAGISLRVGVALSIATAGIVAPALPAAAADLGALAIAGGTGSTISGSPRVTASAPCPTGTEFATASVSGAGFSGPNDNGSVNFFGSTPATSTSPVSLTTGNTWDAIAIDAGATRPLNGTATIFINCRDADGATTDTFQKDIVFVGSGPPGSPGTWTEPATPTPQPPPIECPTATDCFGLPAAPPTSTPAPVAATATEAFRLKITAPTPCTACGALTFTIPYAAETRFYPYGWRARGGSLFGASMWPVIVSDTRIGRPAWTLSAQLAPFRSSAGQTFGADLTLRPRIIEPGAEAVAGPGRNPVLAFAPAGHGGDVRPTGRVGGDLFVFAPANAAVGEYTTTLTLTLMS